MAHGGTNHRFFIDLQLSKKNSRTHGKVTQEQIARNIVKKPDSNKTTSPRFVLDLQLIQPIQHSAQANGDQLYLHNPPFARTFDNIAQEHSNQQTVGGSFIDFFRDRRTGRSGHRTSRRRSGTEHYPSESMKAASLCPYCSQYIQDFV